MSVVIFESALSDSSDIAEFYIEGQGDISFDKGVMEVVTQTESFIWCPKGLPADVRIDWEYRPVKGMGSAELVFAAKQSRDENSLDAFILSYYQRSSSDERSFHTSCLYKNSKDNLLFRGADPLPDPSVDAPWYHMSVVKRAKDVFYGINNLEVLHFHDDGIIHGEILTGGHMAFRQLGDIKTQYRNLRITWI